MSFGIDMYKNIPPFFQNLRHNNWHPIFGVCNDLPSVAYQINIPHEDFPLRVEKTLEMVEHMIGVFKESPVITNDILLNIHQYIFDDFPKELRGIWRPYNVVVGNHRPPDCELVPKLMTEFEYKYQHHMVTREQIIDHLTSWYIDFETIHPFADGNGRVGGVIVASLSTAIDWFHNSYLTPGQ